MSTMQAGERYELGDEIAAGGQGLVFEAHDRVLNRDVAVKVLKSGFEKDSAPARRFQEEARITGQLQHPGIPPIHDLGTLPDGRPFLAMKLIRGRTLAQVLEEKPHFSQLLPVFEQVCQAVAYAHDRKVIHRDLKPANVMVGAFGEVQVMDWGLAKVIGEVPTHVPDRISEPGPIATSPEETIAHGTEIHSNRDESSHTRAGSVVGTPAYMPPEQAAGAVDQVDARSDVFGLGGILCALLTGKPPYVGVNSESTRQLAAQVKLEDAWSRLEACGAEAEWIALCKRCMAAEKADRPTDGAEVASAVAGLRTAAEARARQAELDRVRVEGELRNAELKAGELRRRRRIRMALFGSIAVLGLTIAAGYVMVREQRLQRELQSERARTTVEQSLAQVPDFHQRSLWADAMRTLNEGEGLLGPESAPDLRKRLERARRETILLKTLEEIRFGKARLRGFTFSNVEPLQQYERTFNTCHLFEGASPTFLARDRAAVAKAVRESPIKDFLIAALDDWTFTLKDEVMAKSLLEVTADATGLEWRRTLDPFSKDPAGLNRQVRAIPRSERTPALVGLLSERMPRSEGSELLLDGLAQFPNDFWLHLHLAFAVDRKPERLAALRSAIALRPDAFSIRIVFLSTILDSTLAPALTVMDVRIAHEMAVETHRLWPNEPLSANYLGATHGRLGHHDEAEAFYRKSIALEKGGIAHVHWNGLGLALRNAGKWEAAAQACRAGIAVNGNTAVLHHNLGVASLVLGQYEAAIESFETSLRTDSSNSPSVESGSIAGIGAACFALGRVADAEAQFRRAEKANAETAELFLHFLKEVLTQRHSNPALAAHLAGRLTKSSVVRLEETIRAETKLAALESRPPRNLDQMYGKLGEIQYANKLTAEAEQSFRKVLEHHPMSAYAYDWLAFLRLEQHDAAGSLRYAERSVSLDPKSAQGHFNLGRARLATRNIPGAVAAFQEASRLDPKRTDAKQFLDYAKKFAGIPIAPPPRERNP
jgi:tetratricopeptide (TPR) repeat protein/predicted Ser/Thr protein kinase